MKNENLLNNVLSGILGSILTFMICFVIFLTYDTPVLPQYKAMNLETNTIATIKSNTTLPNAYNSGDMVFVDNNDTINNQDPDAMMFTILEPLN